MVERFNGRIEEVLQSHHFRSGEDLETTLHRYVWLYNQQLPQSALASKAPLQAMKDWHKIKPELFKKQPYYLPGCDSYVFGLSKNGRLARNISALEASTAARYVRTPGQKLRRFKTFSYAARSWSKPRRVIARVEVGLMANEHLLALSGSSRIEIATPSLGS
ncbi:hypothetical protein JSE7799_02536 [Jannaschia seosinensis]|uniref:Transposase DDE domain-containing protein n=3 Tax=Jannaschia seosinensis TaxID=313367 RepID=A0A0M7BCK9_9RHOB|nr:hypothetical protein JSE7799_02536 [Jannaschia seosinensis]